MNIRHTVLSFGVFLMMPVLPAAMPLECVYDAPFTSKDGWGLAFLCENITDTPVEEIGSWKGEYLLDGKRRVFLRDVPFHFKRPLAPGEKRRLRLILAEETPKGKGEIRGAILREIALSNEEEDRAWWLKAPLPMDGEHSLILWGCRDMIRSRGDGALSQIRFLGTIINNDPSLTLVGLKDAVFFFGDAKREETMRLRRHVLVKPVGPGERMAFNITIPVPDGMRVTRFGWQKATLVFQKEIR